MFSKKTSKLYDDLAKAISEDMIATINENNGSIKLSQIQNEDANKFCSLNITRIYLSENCSGGVALELDNGKTIRAFKTMPTDAQYNLLCIVND